MPPLSLIERLGLKPRLWQPLTWNGVETEDRTSSVLSSGSADPRIPASDAHRVAVGAGQHEAGLVQVDRDLADPQRHPADDVGGTSVESMWTWAVCGSRLTPVRMTTLPRSKAGLPGTPPAIAGTTVVT